MIRALSTAATGLEAQAANIERISNDLANVNTDAYKRSRQEFQDLMYETIKAPGGQLGAATQSPVGIQTGMGVRVGASHKLFEPGPARMTYHPFDIMIEGHGFLPVQTPNGEVARARAGRGEVGMAVTLAVVAGVAETLRRGERERVGHQPAGFGSTAGAGVKST
jgi:flagellar basal-body rod protein FlgG